MTENQIKTKNRTKTKLVLDVLIFIAFLVAMEPRSSGIPIHEWLATSILAVLVVHLLLSWDWIVQTTQRFLGKLNTQTRLNYILNWGLFIDVMLLMLSGLAISESVMPTLGIGLPRNFAWRGLHELSANLFIVLLGLHTALHWSWVVDTFKRYVFQPIERVFSTNTNKDIPA
jgi:cytochrome b